MSHSEESQAPTTSAAAAPPAVRILIVDDDVDQIELQCELLMEQFPAANITAVNTGEEALTLDPAKFDVALLDVQLPDYSGIELLARLRASHDLPVVMVTGDRSGESTTKAIRAGAADFVIKHGDYLRVVPLVVEKVLAMMEIKNANRRLEAELRKRNGELEELNRQFREMALHDSLTGLYNRHYFNELLGRLFSESMRYQTDLTCVMVDIDNFKRVNDTRGHQIGDRVLQLVASVIRRSIRESDIAVRYGGDEFVIILPRTSPDDARASAKRILTEFRRELTVSIPEAAVVSLSIGVASRGEDQPATSESLVRLADEALYLAKAGGKNRIMVLRPVSHAGRSEAVPARPAERSEASQLCSGTGGSSVYSDGDSSLRSE